MTTTSETAEVTVLPEAGAEEEAAGGYQQQLGAKLRAVRRTRGLRLQDVEELSEGRFKAVVIGSYERGDRAVSAHKLASLAAFYEVPVVELLPDEERSRQRGSDDTLAIDLRRLREQADDPELAPLLRLVRHVQWLRDDYNGQILSLRTDDFRTIAVSMGTPADQLDAWLDERELLHR